MRERVTVETTAGVTWRESVWSGGELVAERDSDGTLLTYVWGPDRTPLAVKVASSTRPSGTYYYHTDAAGSVVALTDESGEVVASYRYDAFGALVQGGEESWLEGRNPLRYRAYYADDETGLYYLPARYYEPETARFLSPDPAPPSAGDPLSLNAYAYCQGDPVNASDPSGAVIDVDGDGKTNSRERAIGSGHAAQISRLSRQGYWRRYTDKARSQAFAEGNRACMYAELERNTWYALGACLAVEAVLGGFWLWGAYGAGAGGGIAQAVGDPSDEAEVVKKAVNGVLRGGDSGVLSNVSEKQLAQYANHPGMQRLVYGHGVHNGAAKALGEGWLYNASRGPDFFNGSAYVELTTHAQMAEHLARYGATSANGFVGSYGGFPVHFVGY